MKLVVLAFVCIALVASASPHHGARRLHRSSFSRASAVVCSSFTDCAACAGADAGVEGEVCAFDTDSGSCSKVKADGTDLITEAGQCPSDDNDATAASSASGATGVADEADDEVAEAVSGATGAQDDDEEEEEDASAQSGIASEEEEQDEELEQPEDETFATGAEDATFATGISQPCSREELLKKLMDRAQAALASASKLTVVCEDRVQDMWEEILEDQDAAEAQLRMECSGLDSTCATQSSGASANAIDEEDDDVPEPIEEDQTQEDDEDDQEIAESGASGNVEDVEQENEDEGDAESRPNFRHRKAAHRSHRA